VDDEWPNEDALIIAIKAKAIETCYFHSDVTINLGDQEAERRAYAMGTNYWKAHKDKMTLDRAEFMDAIKYVIDMAGDECYQCTKYRDD
jgi:hypothetical protein